MDQFSLEMVRNFSEFQELIIEKKKFGHYKELHELQFQMLNHLAQNKIWHHLESSSLELLKEYPHHFTYYFFHLLVLSELDKTQVFNQLLLELLDNILYQGRTFEDFKGGKEEFLELIIQIKSPMSDSVDHYKWECISELIRSLIQKKSATKKDLKFISNLLLIDQDSLVFRFCLYLISFWQKNSLSYLMYDFGLRNKLLDFVSLTKFNPWLKEIIVTQEKEDLLKKELGKPKIEEPVPFYLKARKLQSITFEANEFIDESPIIISLRVTPPDVNTIPDLIMAYQMMSFENVVKELFKIASTQKLNSELSQKIRYMELNYYIQRKEFHIALSISQEMRLLDLDQEQLLEMDYVEGTILLKLGKRGEALISFQRVFRMNKDYRQVQERLKEIEKN